MAQLERACQLPRERHCTVMHMCTLAALLVNAYGASAACAPARRGMPPADPPSTLVDHAIASGIPPLYLDGDGWTATNIGGPQEGIPSINATVPGDILSDLQRAGRVNNP
jgi:hypothetical protein